MKNILFALILLFLNLFSFSQETQPLKKQTSYWNIGLQINSYRLPPPSSDKKTEYLDLDNDGDPDVLKTFTIRDIPVQWIDDDDDMKSGDWEGDNDNDCLMIDWNKDGKYSSATDLMIDWNDTNGDKKADMQVFIDIPEGRSGGHYMWVIDTDKDNIFNNIDWEQLKLRCWLHDGNSDFYEDYHGKSLFLKAHCSPDRINDPRLNWENPFLFYDPDNDGLTEMAIRLLDIPERKESETGSLQLFSGKITWASMAFDLDNDNNPGNEFDFDMTIGFAGEKGFDYLDQVHRFNNMRGLPEADQFFADPKWRQISELIYPGHETAWNLIFERGKWDQAQLVYDEDDDCARWERVEFYEQRNPFKIGKRNEGIDNNPQADASGDRGEWDADNSGNGQLYISRFDGRIHLYGAEKGTWRIDQNAWSFQGMGGLYDGYGPERLQKQPPLFATIQYADTDNNGFFDQIEYDLDGDTIFEQAVSLHSLGIDDRCEIINTASMDYSDFIKLKKSVAEDIWKNALGAVEMAKKEGINESWYSLLMHPKSVRQKYHHGYWLQFYLFNDLINLYTRKECTDCVEKIRKAYYSGDWQGYRSCQKMDINK